MSTTSRSRNFLNAISESKETVPRRSLDRELADNSYLLRQWKSWRDEQREEAVAGPNGSLVAQLLDVLRGLTLGGGAELVAFIRSQNWNCVDFDTRLCCLHEINDRITKLREQAGMPPFDDGFGPERINGFLIIKHMMIGS
jgi:hypothetical protein